MTMFRGVDQLYMPRTIAEDTHEDGVWSKDEDFVMWQATRDRATWEAGYTAGLYNATHPRIIWQEEQVIVCPECQEEQAAVIVQYEGHPFPIYWRECYLCGYEIGESEWNRVEDTAGQDGEV